MPDSGRRKADPHIQSLEVKVDDMSKRVDHLSERISKNEHEHQEVFKEISSTLRAQQQTLEKTQETSEKMLEKWDEIVSMLEWRRDMIGFGRVGKALVGFIKWSGIATGIAVLITVIEKYLLTALQSIV